MPASGGSIFAVLIISSEYALNFFGMMIWLSCSFTSSNAGGARSRVSAAGSRASRTASAPASCVYSPFLSSATASANGFTMRSGANQPRSPPLSAEPCPPRVGLASVAEVGAALELLDDLLRDVLAAHQDVPRVVFDQRRGRDLRFELGAQLRLGRRALLQIFLRATACCRRLRRDSSRRVATSGSFVRPSFSACCGDQHRCGRDSP